MMQTQFSSRRGSSSSRVAIEQDLCKNIGDIDACTDFEMLKVKVPINFLGTAGFSLRREGRYCIKGQKNIQQWVFAGGHPPNY
jgi:hypothetical protein